MADLTVGMVGLGLMGQNFVKRLVHQGYETLCHDVVPEKIAAAEAHGGKRATSPATLAEAADIVLICVTTPQNVVEVVAGRDGILAAENPRCRVIVDHSTTDIATTNDLAQRCASRGTPLFVDAPVSGGPPAVEAGTLAIMAGGDERAICAVRPLMQTLGTFTHMGGSGAGQATKLVNQILVLNNFVVMAEALRMAEAYGVDAAKIPDALASGHAGSNLLPSAFARMIPRDWTPTGYARQVLKDLEMVSAAAKDKGLAQPITGQSLMLYRMLVGQGRGDIDGTAVLELLPEGKKDTP